MQPAEDLFAPRVKVLNREDAERLVGNVTATMAALESVLDDETAHLQAGRVRDGLAQEERKSDLAGAYLRGLEACKDRIETLKSAHTGFRQAVERNQLVIATARAVSEGLVRGLAEEMTRAASPQVYGATRVLTPLPKRAQPILCSRVY
jgi:hypothetical protein